MISSAKIPQDVGLHNFLDGIQAAPVVAAAEQFPALPGGTSTNARPSWRPQSSSVPLPTKKHERTTEAFSKKKHFDE